MILTSIVGIILMTTAVISATPIDPILSDIPLVKFESLNPAAREAFTTHNQLGLLELNVPLVNYELGPETVAEPSLFSTLGLSSALATWFPSASGDHSPDPRPPSHPESSLASMTSLPDITWVPITTEPSLLGLALSGLSTLDILLTSPVPFTAIHSNVLFDSDQTFGSTLHQCHQPVNDLVASHARQRVQILESSIQRRRTQRNAHPVPPAAQGPQSQSLGQSRLAPAGKSAPSPPSSDTMRLELHHLHESRLIADAATPYQCTITIPRYGYFSPFAQGKIGIHINQAETRTLVGSALSLFGGPGSGNTGAAVSLRLAFKPQTIDLAGAVLSLLLLGLFIAIPMLVEQQLFHLVIGTLIGAVGISLIAMYLIVRLSPFKRLAGPATLFSIFVGYVGNIHQIVISRIYQRWPMETLFVVGFGALIGFVMTVWFVKWDHQYSGATVSFVRLIILFVWATVIQNLLVFVALVIIVLLYSSSRPSEAVAPLPTPTHHSLHQFQRQAPQQHHQSQQQQPQQPRQYHSQYQNQSSAAGFHPQRTPHHHHHHHHPFRHDNLFPPRTPTRQQHHSRNNIDDQSQQSNNPATSQRQWDTNPDRNHAPGSSISKRTFQLPTPKAGSGGKTSARFQSPARRTSRAPPRARMEMQSDELNPP